MNKFLPPNYVLETRLSIHERREKELNARLSTTLDSGKEAPLAVDDEPVLDDPACPPSPARRQESIKLNEGKVDEEGIPYSILPKWKVAPGTAKV